MTQELSQPLAQEFDVETTPACVDIEYCFVLIFQNVIIIERGRHEHILDLIDNDSASHVMSSKIESVIHGTLIPHYLVEGLHKDY